MNIFVTSADPKESAKVLDDRRVVKMILESAQMLSTTMFLKGIEGNPLKPCYENHPCTRWVCESKENYVWLLDHFHALMDEYESRFPGRTHSYRKHSVVFNLAAEKLESSSLTPFANCTQHKHMEVHSAYKRCLREKWEKDKLKPRWFRQYKDPPL